jgi:hypothetical protein
MKRRKILSVLLKKKVTDGNPHIQSTKNTQVRPEYAKIAFTASATQLNNGDKYCLISN